MTVAELLERIMAAYPGATNEAMKTFVPVFYARMRRHEGEALETAATEVLGSFRPKFDQKFPIPADFEAHLPSGKLHIPNGGPAIDFRAHRERKRALEADWQAGQGAKIREARGPYVWAHCLFEAQRQAAVAAWRDHPGRVILSAEQIQACEDQVVSTARVQVHGASVLRRGDRAAWEGQTASLRASLRAGEWPAGHRREPGETESSVRPSQAMQERLAELARNRRRGFMAGAPQDRGLGHDRE